MTKSEKHDNSQISPFPTSITGGGTVLALVQNEVYFETFGLSEEEMDDLIHHHKLQPVREIPGLFSVKFNTVFKDRRWVQIAEGTTPEQIIAELQSDARVRVASPVYHRLDLPFKTALSFADRVLAKLQPGIEVPSIIESAQKVGIYAIAVAAEIEQPDGLLVRLTITEPKKQNALQVTECVSKLQGVKEVHPDWLSLTSSIATTTPNDPLFGQEWDMTQIAAPQGWDLSQGNPNVVIAILDTGCDLNHEDLVAKYVPMGNRRDVVTGTNAPDDDFGHGTCCASLAAAATNNTVGVAGVGWNCQIMPIRMMQNAFINSEADIVSAIDWARTNGADVVSMSWFWPGPTSNADAALAAAAAANIVLVAASGNFNSGITWPALNSHIMAIGASDQIDQRKSPASPDGETWGSNFGAQQSVMAPGVRCWAANNTNGGASFNNNNGGPINAGGMNYPSSGTADGRYYALMNGTSAATPHVAGLAGLLLAANPALTNTQVRTVIEQTAEKTGGYVYTNDGIHNNGTWHQEPGYGRINAFRALQALSPHLVTAIADHGNFGDVCLGSFADELLTINNGSSFASLEISSITSSSPDFQAPRVISYPLVVAAGDSINVAIRFQPTSFGPKSATLSIFGNDPASPHTIEVSGEAQAPRLVTMIANTGNFGKACIGSFMDESLILSNSGKCALSVTSITSSSGEFTVPQVLSYPVTIGGGNYLPIPIRFEPASFGPKLATLMVISDDPGSPHTIDVSGEAPSGKLAITGSLCFGGVKACCIAERTISICNTGDCKLHVTSVAFKRKSRHWKLINNPFPATLHSGACLSVIIRYKATEKCSRCSELVITSDDPAIPVKILDVMAYTVWNDCGCKQCCEACCNGCCEKRHAQCCSAECYDDCCDDDRDEDEAEGDN